MADDNTSHLPLEIIEIVLSKISTVKSLLRFKTVSKSWNIILSDPVFVENHIRRSKKHSNLFLLPTLSTSSARFSLVKSEGKKFHTLQEIAAPFGCNSVLCFCDGTLLLTDGTYRRFALWNPSTRTATKLWHRCRCDRATFGLCRDPNTNDFKVVVVAPGYYSVYSCKNKSWIAMKKDYEIQYTDVGLTCCTLAGVCVDGASYWVWRNQNVRRWQILYYDPRDDNFKTLHKPENIEDNKWIDLVNLRGSLCLYYCDDVNKGQIWTKENGIDNNSWKKLITVESARLPIWPWSRLRFEPLYFVENKILFRIGPKLLALYSPCDKRFENFEEERGIGLLPVPYIESLYFPFEKPRPNRKWTRKCSPFEKPKHKRSK